MGERRKKGITIGKGGGGKGRIGNRNWEEKNNRYVTDIGRRRN